MINTFKEQIDKGFELIGEFYKVIQDEDHIFYKFKNSRDLLKPIFEVFGEKGGEENLKKFVTMAEDQFK